MLIEFEVKIELPIIWFVYHIVNTIVEGNRCEGGRSSNVAFGSYINYYKSKVQR